MKDLSPEARTRLSAITWYETVRDVALVCRTCGISRKTFYKWYTRYTASGNDIASLESQSRVPVTKRVSTLSPLVEKQIKMLREKHLALGKVKLQILYEKKYNTHISQHHITTVIQKYNLYPLHKRIRTARIRKGVRKVRIHEVQITDYTTPEKPFFFATDTIVLYLPYGIKRYILTALDLEGKLAYARVYGSKSSLSACDFLFRLELLTDGKIAAILSDNGSEFARYFDEGCRKLLIPHIYSRNKTPKDNACDERFNRTVKEEFMQTDEYFEPSLTNTDLREANTHLTNWLIFYNFERPHQTLNYKTPIEWYNTRYQLLEVSPMYSAITFT